MRKEEISDNLFIKDLIRLIHKELTESQSERVQNNEAPLFEVDSLTIEANFIIKEETKGKVGLSFKLLTFGGFDAGNEDNIAKEKVHKISLTLKSITQNSMFRNNMDLKELETIGGLKPREDID
ncbi:MAG: hypothetical protein IT259_09065 [Saprospiraceae bacterium]|nr:hypothetical protein [Saprospiraceae bacterium]